MQVSSPPDFMGAVELLTHTARRDIRRATRRTMNPAFSMLEQSSPNRVETPSRTWGGVRTNCGQTLEPEKCSTSQEVRVSGGQCKMVAFGHPFQAASDSQLV